MKTAMVFLFIIPTVPQALAGVGKDTITLNDVVKTEQLTYNADNASPFTDLKYKTGERLCDALSEFSSVYVKSYGSGGLATLAFCGTTVEETEIEWNGVRLNSPSLGQLDLALLLLGIQDEVELVRTGYEGNIGGILRLNNVMKLDTGYSISALFRAGSFGTYNTALDAQYALGKFSGSTKAVYLTSLNDFPYINTYAEGNPVMRQINGDTKQVSVLQQLNGKITPNQELNFYGWYTGAARQIPPLMSQPTDAQYQYDYSIRLMADWKANFNGMKLKLTSAWMEDYLHYIDTDAGQYDKDITYTWRNMLNVGYVFPFNLALNGGVNYDREQANIAEYGSNKVRDIEGIRLYVDYYLNNLFKFHTGFREDLVDNELSAFAPEASVAYLPKLKAGNTFSANIMASRNFRFPTLNELYWIPGGNPDLKEEKSFNAEIRAKYSWRKIVDVSVSNFYIYANDMIVWVPTGTGVIWVPENLQSVFSRGIETAILLTNAPVDNPRKFSIHLNASYTYTKATNLDASSPGDMSQGKQLMYVPYHNLTIGLQLGYRRFYIRSANTYTGLVYTSTDNTQYLDGYFIPNLEIGKDFLLKGMELGLSVRANNIDNQQYVVVADRPMPGRNFEATLRLKFFR